MIEYSFEYSLNATSQILTSIGFDVNRIGPITYNATSDRFTFYYKDDTIWQVDFKNKKCRCMEHGAWTDWVKDIEDAK